MSTINDISIPGIGAGILQPKQKHKWRVRFTGIGDSPSGQAVSLQATTVERPKLSHDEVELHRYNKTLMFDILSYVKCNELLEYGLELLIHSDDIIFLLKLLNEGYKPSKQIVRKIVDNPHGSYILNIIDKKYPIQFQSMLPHMI